MYLFHIGDAGSVPHQDIRRGTETPSRLGRPGRFAAPFIDVSPAKRSYTSGRERRLWKQKRQSGVYSIACLMIAP